MAGARWRKERTGRSWLRFYRPRLELLESRSLPSFITAPTYDAGRYPTAVAVGDFTGDGRLDLAVANDLTNGTVSVLLANADGTFQAPVSYAVGSSPDSVADGDFTGDGRLDLAVANAGSKTVTILLGNGDGSFRAAGSYPVAGSPQAVAVGDVNGDGFLDLVTANSSTGSVSILLGNGDGTFQAATTYATDSTNAVGVAVGHFDGDRDLDIAVAAYDYVNHQWLNPKITVLLGNGDGTFRPPVSYAAAYFPDAVAVGDLKGDGIADLVTANYASNSVSVLAGNGDGTFQAPVSYPVGSYPNAVAVGDFNGDGLPDLVALNGNNAIPDALNPGTVSVLLNRGDGTFQAAANYAVGNAASSVAVGDLTGDGALGLVVTNINYNGTVTVLRGNGDGSFWAAPSYSTGGADAFFPTVGDLTGNGIADLVIPNYQYNAGTVGVLLGNGDGTFQAAHTYATDLGPNQAVIGDFAGDGIADLAVANFNGNTVSVLMGNGDGTFQTAVNYAAGFEPRGVTATDLTGDGILDLLVPYGFGVNVLRGNGDGTFQAPVSYPVSEGATAVAVGDFNGDGIPDLAVAGNKVSILLGNGDGSFQAPVTYNVAGVDATDVVAGDFTGTGHLDLAVPTYGANTLSILLGNGDGTFQAPVNYVLDSNPYGVTVADFNGDGIPDLSVPTFAGVNILTGNGDGSFQAPVVAAPIYGDVTVGDFNGDGSPDLAVTNGVEVGMVTILLNTADGGRAHPAPSQTQHPATASRPSRIDRLPPLAIESSLSKVPSPLPGNELPLSPSQPVPRELGIGPPPEGGPLARASMPLLIRHAPDALVAEGWEDGLALALALES